MTLRATRAITKAVYGGRCVAFSAPRRCYAHSSYGGEGETKAPKNPRTQSIEHPGPPPPDTSTHSSSKTHSHKATPSESETHQPQEHDTTAKTHHKTVHHGREHSGISHESSHQTPIPSNKARPTLNDGAQTPNVDADGNTRESVPEDVKKHNAEMEERHDRTYNQLGR